MNEVLLVILGFFVTFIGTLAGSGGLIGMPALLLFGLPIHSTIATAKFANMISSFSTFIQLFKQKQFTLKQITILIPFAALGGTIGALITNIMSENTMTIIAVILLSGAFILAIIRKPQVKENNEWKLPKKILPTLFGISVYDGMFGPGQATLSMYTLLLSGSSYLKAVAITRFQTFISCFFAFIPYLLHGNFIWQVALYYASGSLVGSYVALKVAPHLSIANVKKLLHLVTIALIISLCWQLVS